MSDYLAGDSVLVTVSGLVDASGDPVTPVSAQYRLDDLTTGAQIIGWTALPTPTTNSVAITITGSQNTPLERALEQLQCSVQVTDSSGNNKTFPVCWTVQAVVGACGCGC